MIIWILKLIDGILSILDVSNVLTEFNYDFNKIDALEYFINNSIINNLFWNIFVFTIGLICFFSILGIVKVIVKNHTTIFDVLSKFVFAIIASLIVLSLIFL